MSLIQHCQAILKKAEKRIEKISQPEAKSQQETEDTPF
jgi:exonuclease VII small subunit